MEIKDNIDKIHSTEMGLKRIARNIGLSGDVIAWCKSQIMKSNEITRKGKNWYAAADNAIITINAQSFTIITARKLDDK